MSDRDEAEDQDPSWGDDELGGLRGVVLDETATVTTVTEPPREPAQPPESPSGDETA